MEIDEMMSVLCNSGTVVQHFIERTNCRRSRLDFAVREAVFLGNPSAAEALTASTIVL
jgi:hypothetical protein